MTISVDSKVGHSDLLRFAEKSINLPHDDVVEYRAQAQRLRERLEAHIDEHPDFDLVKMQYAGSVAKGTALRSINDMDVAVYVKAASAPDNETALIDWMYDRLRETYSTFDNDQFEKQHHCVTITFRGSGLDVDIVPVLFEGDGNDYGYLIAKDSGDRVMTSIPRHLEFIRKRKNAHPRHFRQLVRLAKYWTRQRKVTDPTFRFKSFLVELILAKLVDDGLDPSDYPAALTSFLAYIIQSGLRTRVAFNDYPESKPGPRQNTAMEICDPVNGKNNVAKRYRENERLSIVLAAQEAFDAITFARLATTKEDAIAQWRLVFGSGFSA